MTDRQEWPLGNRGETDDGRKRIVAFGEIMLRLSPPAHRLLPQTSQLDLWVGGAEANVASALAQLGHRCMMVSAVPDTELGDMAVHALGGHGVDCSAIRRNDGRMGLYWAQTGAGLRATDILYDRTQSAFANVPADMWDWETLLRGATRLHLSGITPALGPNATAGALRAAATATALGIPVSFDGNYRARLWECWEGRPSETLHALVDQADILFGNHRDVTLLLGRTFAGAGAERRREAAKAAFAAYPRLAFIASTARRVESVDLNHIVARVDTRVRGYETEELAVPGIIDRIGTGDAFAAGVLHARLTGGSPLEMAQTGLALSALKHSIPGDQLICTRRSLKQFMTAGLDVRR